jgi:O-antigen ligase
MLLGVLLIFILKMFMETGYDQRIARHPVSVAIFINLIWIFITCFTSEIPIVSIKFLVARLWFIIPFYFVAIVLFKDFKNIRNFNWLYVIPLMIVIAYTLFNHAQWGFDKPSSNMVMKPFYNDHTAYGAVIAMFVPLFFASVWNRIYTRSYRFLALGVVTVLIVGLIFSYSRAAWLSVAFTLAVYLIIYFKIKFRWIFLTLGILIGFFFMFRYQFIDKLEKNKQDSSTDFVEHVQSISNISSDASNLERINRWQSAIRLFEERPVFGWGPGTYQFVYAPYQRSKERTIISTNYGDMGNAHSEYIGPLSESGVLGMITFLAIVISVIITALRVYRQSRNKEVRMYVLMIFLGLVTYYVHGVLNNFLDTDKASVPFWGFAAMIVAIDLYHRYKENGDRKADDPELLEE